MQTFESVTDDLSMRSSELSIAGSVVSSSISISSTDASTSNSSPISSVKVSPVRTECLRHSFRNNTDRRPLTVLYSKTLTWPHQIDTPVKSGVNKRDCVSVDTEVKQILSMRRTIDGVLVPSMGDDLPEDIHVITPLTHHTQIALECVAEVASYCEEAEYSGTKNATNTPNPDSFNPSASIDDIHGCFLLICSEGYLVEKLQAMVRTLKRISSLWVQLAKQHNGHSCVEPSGDELLDMLVLLLCQWNASLMAEMYPHVMFLSDHLPTVFDGGQFAYALIQFVISFDFIKERIVFKKNKLSKSPTVPT